MRKEIQDQQIMSRSYPKTEEQIKDNEIDGLHGNATTNQ